MNTIFSLLGKSLIKKDKKAALSKSKEKSSAEINSRRAKKKIIVEVFLREVLGTRLLEKKF